ncbi:hypothetical protein [Thermaerobacillus caldiproteolyticus]|uniref:Uncharacterized protein n=1 Tax=Thermaerobacillus caldiproteolyticus TaxID=247480 RepID=A0A7W0BYW4_9BACL|nr:hypothetical protein [Anoxybacillus caldiproteolyticus]MBA2874975.1 hypothetical protein [Anoxybacillus caldiproteolyticus]QPA31773.1 hypothetical protein ISX45_01800 [Anoxybacillus caldiproteolyticus]
MLTVSGAYDSFFYYVHRPILERSPLLSVFPITAVNVASNRYDTARLNEYVPQRKKTAAQKILVDITGKGQWINECI